MQIYPHLKKFLLSTTIGLAAVLATACGSDSGGDGSGGGGGGGNTPAPPPGPVNCIIRPDPSTQFPSQAQTQPDEVWHDYTYNPSSAFKIYGYNNPDPIHVKKIKIVNNYNQLIFPVVFSPTPFTGSDGLQKTMSRIFVGKPSCANPAAFYAGIPAGGSAEVYIPKQMWDTGHVKIFTEAPYFLQEDVGTEIQNPLYTIDNIKSSPNYGYLLYTSGTPNDFPLELPFQLTEYTIESRCKADTPDCATEASDLLTVDFDISAVDQLFLPVAMQESTGSRGFVGTGMSVNDFQSKLLAFTQGGGPFSYDSVVGWPYYYGSSRQLGYKNGLIKIPMGYNVLNSILFPSPTPYDPNHVINSTVVLNKNSNQLVTDQGTLQNVANNIVGRWTPFWQTIPTICNGRADQNTFCQDFTDTLKFLDTNILNACKYSLSSSGIDPVLCTTAGNSRAVVSDTEKVRAIVGYSFAGTTFSESGGPYPISDLNSMCKSETDPNPVRNAVFYSNCFRDAAKSAQRGVPYPYWEYPTQYYPEISSIYNLNPVVWFVHQYLGLSVYAFSVDDDIGNQELVGNGFTITVGGVNGLTSSTAFEPRKSQIIAFPGGSVNPQWQGTLSSSSVCLPGRVGACDLNIQDGGYSSVDVKLTGIPGVTNPNYFLNFTITSGGKQTCSIPGLPDYEYDQLVITNCSTSAGLQNCAPANLYVALNNPTHSCAQTVSLTNPIP